VITTPRADAPDHCADVGTELERGLHPAVAVAEEDEVRHADVPCSLGLLDASQHRHVVTRH
jgi:hypothetical protein